MIDLMQNQMLSLSEQINGAKLKIKKIFGLVKYE